MPDDTNPPAPAPRMPIVPGLAKAVAAKPAPPPSPFQVQLEEVGQELGILAQTQLQVSMRA